MAATSTEIIQDIVAALRQCGALAAVTLGDAPGEGAVPRASVEPQGQDGFTPDGFSEGRWVRLRMKVAIRTRAQSETEGLARLEELAQAATATILADPYRGGRCEDLPIGRATEVERVELPKLARPEFEAVLSIRCHVEECSGGPGASSLDGQDLFGSGPHSFREGPCQRRLERRVLPGLAGELLVDRGPAPRTIHQNGRLRGPTAAAVQALVAAIEAKVDGRGHALVDSHGRDLGSVVLESFEPTTPLRSGLGFWCEYTCRYSRQP